MKTYYITKPDGTQIGPLTATSITQLKLQGVIGKGSLIWTEEDEWQPFEHVFPDELFPIGTWNIINAFTHSFRPYASIAGRAGLAEFWLFRLASLVYAGILILLTLGLCNGSEGSMNALLIIGGVSALVMILPDLAVTIRRLHDIGLSGWFLLLHFVPYLGSLIVLILLLLPSKGPNKYGYGPYVPLKRR